MKLSTTELLEIYETTRRGIEKTPLIFSENLSKASGGKVYLKLENLQTTHSFKARGAYFKLSKLTPAQKKKGVMAISAGNHGKAVAYFGKQLGIPVTVVMPITSSKVKADACKEYGAAIHFFGDHLSESFAFGYDLAQKMDVTVIHPYDDEDIIRGQSTIITEMTDQIKTPPDTIIVPVGGGGLSSGICLSAAAFWKETKVVGVQSMFAPEMAELLFAHKSPKNKTYLRTIAEGIAVKTPGKITQAILKKYLSHIYVLDEEYISQAVYHAMMEEKLVLEGAGAAGLAAFLMHTGDFKGKTVVIILCGGNVDGQFLNGLFTQTVA